MSKFINARAANVVLGSKAFPVMYGYDTKTCIPMNKKQIIIGSNQVYII